MFFLSDELKKKISESYSLFRSHVIEDLRPVRETEWSEIQQACRFVVSVLRKKRILLLQRNRVLVDLGWVPIFAVMNLVFV